MYVVRVHSAALRAADSAPPVVVVVVVAMSHSLLFAILFYFFCLRDRFYVFADERLPTGTEIRHFVFAAGRSERISVAPDG